MKFLQYYGCLSLLISNQHVLRHVKNAVVYAKMPTENVQKHVKNALMPVMNVYLKKNVVEKERYNEPTCMFVISPKQLLF